MQGGEGGGERGERGSWSQGRGSQTVPSCCCSHGCLVGLVMGRGFPGWDPCPPSCPSPWRCQPWRPLRAGLVGEGVVPLFLFLAARDPTGWG